MTMLHFVCMMCCYFQMAIGSSSLLLSKDYKNHDVLTPAPGGDNSQMTHCKYIFDSSSKSGYGEHLMCQFYLSVSDDNLLTITPECTFKSKELSFLNHLYGCENKNQLITGHAIEMMTRCPIITLNQVSQYIWEENILLQMSNNLVQTQRRCIRHW